MKSLATLLDQLTFAHGRLRKIALMAHYFRETPDPERGWALAMLTGKLNFAEAKSSQLKAMILERVDPVLFAFSYDYVGDMAETVSLLWPVVQAKEGIGHNRPPLPPLPEIIETLSHTPRAKVPEVLADWLDAAESEPERWTLIKLVTGNLRIGVSERLAKTALAEAFSADLGELEQLWHGLTPPYIDLFRWLEGKGEKPDVGNALTFRPLMLSHPIEEREMGLINPQDFMAEWKWDGIRVQLVGDGERMALFLAHGGRYRRGIPGYCGAKAGQCRARW